MSGKKKIQFLLGSLSLVLGFFSVSYAQVNCPSDATNYSSNSANGIIYYDAGTWYINSKSAPSVCFGNASCRAYVGCASLDACTKSFAAQYTLLKGAPPYGSMTPQDVGRLQQIMQEFKCPTNIDCKFGRGTIKSILSCPLTPPVEDQIIPPPSPTTDMQTVTQTNVQNQTIPPVDTIATNNEIEANCTPEKKPGHIRREGRCICDPNNTEGVCCGVKLNTLVPFIGKCIVSISEADAKTLNLDKTVLEVTEDTAFPRLMLGLTKILVTVILLASFIAIIVAGVMMTASGSSEEGYSKGTKLIGAVIASLALLGASGVILRLVNPNFFG